MLHVWEREAHSIETHKPNFSATQDYRTLTSLGCLHTNLVILLLQEAKTKVQDIQLWETNNSQSTEAVLWEPGAGSFVVQIC